MNMDIEKYIRHLAKLEVEKLRGEMQVEIRNLAHDVTTGYFVNKIENDLKAAGSMWTKTEDGLLVDEVNAAIARIAANHGRSITAINCRIRDKVLIY